MYISFGRKGLNPKGHLTPADALAEAGTDGMAFEVPAKRLAYADVVDTPISVPPKQAPHGEPSAPPVLPPAPPALTIVPPPVVKDPAVKQDEAPEIPPTPTFGQDRPPIPPVDLKEGEAAPPPPA